MKNVPITTVHLIIQIAENDSGHQEIERGGWKAQIMTNKRTLKERDVMNIRQVARKFDCSKHHIEKTLSEKTTVVCQKK